MQPLFAGQRATRWEDPNGYSHDVTVLFPDSLRATTADIAAIPVASANRDGASGLPAVVPLSQVANITAGMGPQQIERRQLERQVSLAAGVLPGYSMGNVAADVQRAIDDVNLPAGYHTEFTGDVQNLQDTKGYVLAALRLAVVFTRSRVPDRIRGLTGYFSRTRGSRRTVSAR